MRIVEHIRKNLTLFESDRQSFQPAHKIYQEQHSPGLSQQASNPSNRGHLQTLLDQRKRQPVQHRVQFSQHGSTVSDQYTQYRASDLDPELVVAPSSKNEKLPVVQPRSSQLFDGPKARTLNTGNEVNSQHQQAKNLRRSFNTFNDLLKRPLEFVAKRSKVKRSPEAIQSEESSESALQYKVPVKQLYSCSRSLYLLPELDYTVHIATRAVRDIALSHQRARQRAFLVKQHKEATQGNQNKLLLLLGSYTLARSSSSTASKQAVARKRSRSFGSDKTRKLALSSSQNLASRVNDSVYDCAAGRVKAKVRMPSGKSDKAIVTDNKDGTVKISYEPKEVGQHEISLRYNDEPIDESPIVFYVDAIGSAKKKITAYGAGLAKGRAGDVCKFTINTGGLGSAKLNVSVEGPSKTQVNLNDNKDGTIAVSYQPLSPGEYKIKISFDGKQVVGSPFTTTVTDEGRQRSHINVGRGSEHTLDLKISEEDIKTLDAVIVTPYGIEEPCPLKLINNGQLAIVFTPREQGEHVVNVRRRGNMIGGSPYKFPVLSRDIGDAKQVKVSGKGLKEGKTNTDNELTISTKEAGYGGLSVALEGPGRSEISSKDAQDGIIKLVYRTSEPGQYSLGVKYADHIVPGSPFPIKVSGQGSNPQREVLKKFRKVADQVDANSEAHFTFKLPGVSAYDLSARIHSPQGKSEDASVIDKGDFVYQVTFTPKEVGLYSLSIRNKDIHLAGSPFPFTVGPLLDAGAHRVRCGGPGLLRGACGKSNEFNVYTREGGAGELTVIVEGPSRAELSYTDRKDGSCHIGYKVSEPGEYRIGVLFNDQEVPESPFRANIMPVTGDVSKIELGPMPPENMIQLNKPCNMTVIMNGAKGNIDGKVRLPSGLVEDCFASPIDAENWGVRFIPRELGIHQVHIKFNKGSSHIPQSPVFIRVGHDNADPAAVLAHGHGLKGATVNHATDFTIETCNAGHALLEVNIEGPSKVSMGCAEIDEGYRVNYTPLAPGDYLISIKYNGSHIGPSPYKVRAVKQPGSRAIADPGSHEISTITISTTDREAKQKVENMPKFKSDASRVYCKGMGLKKAFAGKPNTLTVNCSEAGFNMISASFLGPTRNTIHECGVKHLGGSIYEVKYTCKDKGDAILIVKYGDEQIPGSPFRLECV